MKLAIMQPYFFPYIGYYQAIYAVDKYILYDKVNFVKKSWLSRNRLLALNGDISFFNVELKEKSSTKKIHEIELIESNSWRKKILNFIYHNYKKTKYFEEVFPIIESVVNYPTNKLNDINFQSVFSICNYLGITTEISSDSSKYERLEHELNLLNLKSDYFENINLEIPDAKVFRVLKICKEENASTYINAIGGQALYNKKDFNKNGIELFFINTHEYQYNQLSKNFITHLSIIDVVMNCGKEGTMNLIKNFSLI